MKFCYENSIKLEEDLKILLTDIESYQVAIGERANKTRDKITSIFNEIRNTINERESTLKQNISFTLEKEVLNFQKKIKEIKEHLQAIFAFKQAFGEIEFLSEKEILLKAKKRYKLSKECLKSIPNVSFNTNFHEPNKDVELHVLWKILNPKSQTPSLHSTTASYANKRIDK
jgi:hypothetical protein